MPHSANQATVVAFNFVQYKVVLIAFSPLQFQQNRATTNRSNGDWVHGNQIDDNYIAKIHSNWQDGIDCDNYVPALTKAFNERNNSNRFDDGQFIFAYYNDNWFTYTVGEGNDNGVLDDWLDYLYCWLW